MAYLADRNRYEGMRYRRCGGSGLKLPVMSLGLWHGFGSADVYENGKEMILAAFDSGITHFDLANNYGPAPGSAEEVFGKILKTELKAHRDEMVIATKAGYEMWPGPYGDGGSKKYLAASLDQSLKRMGLDYVDIFYHHRPDPETPLEETMDALAGFVSAGKALYVGISNYDAAGTKRAAELLRGKGVRCLIHQMRYSMLARENEPVLTVLEEEKMGGIAFSPLAQGVLTGKYRHGVPADSRAAGKSVFLSGRDITKSVAELTGRLTEVAKGRGQTLSQMALAWVLSRKGITSVILGASRPEQIGENTGALGHLDFDHEEIDRIEEILNGTMT